MSREASQSLHRDGRCPRRGAGERRRLAGGAPAPASRAGQCLRCLSGRRTSPAGSHHDPSTCPFCIHFASGNKTVSPDFDTLLRLTLRQRPRTWFPSRRLLCRAYPALFTCPCPALSLAVGSDRSWSVRGVLCTAQQTPTGQTGRTFSHECVEVNTCRCEHCGAVPAWRRSCSLPARFRRSKRTRPTTNSNPCRSRSPGCSRRSRTPTIEMRRNSRSYRNK